MDSFTCSPLFLFVYLSMYLFEYAKMQFQNMTLLDVLGNIELVSLDDKNSIPG